MFSRLSYSTDFGSALTWVRIPVRWIRDAWHTLQLHNESIYYTPPVWWSLSMNFGKILHLPSSLAAWLEYVSLPISRSPLSRFRPLLWLALPSSLMMLGFAFLTDWLPLKSLFLMQAVSTFFVDCFSPLCHLFDTCGFSLNWGCPPLVSQSRYQVSPPLIKDRSPTCIIFLMNCGFALYCAAIAAGAIPAKKVSISKLHCTYVPKSKCNR